MKTTIIGNQLLLLLLILWAGLLVSCSCTSLEENNLFFNSVDDGLGAIDDDDTQTENKHEVTIAKNGDGTKMLHEKFGAYEQHNIVFDRKVISLVVPPDTIDLLDFTLEDLSVQTDFNAVEDVVEMDESVEMKGNFTCESVGKKMKCTIVGQDAIKMGEKEFRVKLKETPLTSTSIILNERSTVISKIAPYISVVSKNDFYDLRNASGVLPDGYSIVTDEPVDGKNESYTLKIADGTTVKATLIFSHNYHYTDISLIDTRSNYDITLSFSAMPETGKVSCSLFDADLGENGGYSCIVDPTKMGNGIVDFTFNNTYDGAEQPENGTYRLNY